MTDTELLDKLERIIKQRGSVKFEWVATPTTATAGLPVDPYFFDERKRTGNDLREFLGWIEDETDES